jgi:hypothetical protein
LASFRKTPLHNQPPATAELSTITLRHFVSQKTLFLRLFPAKLILLFFKPFANTLTTVKRLTDCDTIATGQGVLF